MPSIYRRFESQVICLWIATPASAPLIAAANTLQIAVPQGEFRKLWVIELMRLDYH